MGKNLVFLVGFSRVGLLLYIEFLAMSGRDRGGNLEED